MSDFTISPVVLTDKLVEKIKSWAGELEIEDVWYCDQQKIPKTPAVCVEPGILSRQLQGDPMQTLNTFTIVLIVYGAGLQDLQETQREVDDLCDRLAAKVNLESTPGNLGGSQMDGLVIYGMVSEHQYGYAVRSNKLMRANRLVWTGMNKTGLVA